MFTPALMVATALLLQPGVNGCDSTIITTLFVNAQPFVTFSGLAASYCKNEPVVLLIGNYSTDGIFSGPGVIGNAFDPSAANPGLNEISYSYTDPNNGCSSTASATVQINEVPAVSIVTATNASCGGSDGSVEITGTGGTPPYSYSWGSNILTDVSAGIYDVTVTDSQGCIGTTAVIVTDNTAPVINIVSTANASCSAVCDGTAEIEISGGAPPYTILWSDGETALSDSNLCTGEYSVLISDNNGCINATVFEIGPVNINPSIFGRVLYSGGAIDGTHATLEVYSRTHHEHGGFDLMTSDVLIGADGSFFMHNFLPDEYILKVLVDTGYYPDVVNSYYHPFHPEYSWDSAGIIILDCGQLLEANIIMYEIAPLGFPGSGLISGTILYFPGGLKTDNQKGISTAFGKATGDPVPGAEIYIEQEPSEEPIANIETDTSGYYEFGNIPDGDYSIWVEIPGFPMLSTYEFTVNDTNTVFDGLNFYVDTTANDGNIDTVLTQIPEEINEYIEISVYPNPFTDYLNISYKLNYESDVNLSVYDATGKLISNLTKGTQGQGEYKYAFASKNYKTLSGTYIIQLRVNKAIYLKKIVQIE
ncbi:MAG: carboxypeptidase regulatory-like domain-containing protein [Bacteroidia bacterium]|nr:carboxypeptidase regulatory-like domain-containing protein [Bacteroidia bacterium]